MSDHLRIAYVDWKEAASDVLYAVRETFKDEFPSILNENYDKLCENYAKEQTEDVIKALGQEVTIDGICLYEVEEDSDSYALVLVKQEEAVAFEKRMKEQKSSIRKLLQPRRKEGMEAKRIDLGKRMPCRVFDLPNDFRPVPQALTDDCLLLDNLSRKETMQSCFLYLGEEPRIKCVIPKLVRKVAKKNDNLYAALVMNPEVDEQGVLRDKKLYVCIGECLENLSEWKVIAEDDRRDEWETLFWYQEDLFLADKQNVAVIRNVAAEKTVNKNVKVEMLFSTDKNDLIFPEFFERNGELYLYLQNTFYAWQKKAFLRKAGFHKKIYTLRAERATEIIPVGDTELAFMERPYSLPRSAELAERAITILDVVSGKTRSLPVKVGELFRYDKNGIGLIHNLSGVKDRKKAPILTMINLENGEKLELLYGAIGNEEIAKVYITSKKQIILRTYEGRLYYPDNLIAYIKMQEGKTEIKKKSTVKKRKTLIKNFDTIVSEGSFEEQKAVFEKCDINAYGGYGNGNAFHFPLSKELMDWILEQGADIEYEDIYGNTPLSAHASGLRNADMVKWLIKAGAKVNVTNHMGNTPMHNAAEAGSIEKVTYLTEAGAKPNEKNKMGYTPLERAIMCCTVSNISGVVEVSKYLLSHGASVTESLQNCVSEYGKKVEFHRKDMATDVIVQVDEGLSELYRIFNVLPVPKRQMHDVTKPIVVKAKTWQKQHEELWDMLVPGSGEAETVQGEVIRLSGRLSYEILDNGAVNWSNGYQDMADKMREYLHMGSPISEEELKEADELLTVIRKGEGDEKELARLTELSVLWVLLNTEPIAK